MQPARNRLNRKRLRFSTVIRVGVNIMKVFSAVEIGNKFVLQAHKGVLTKQNIPHNPGRYTQPTLLHSVGLEGWVRGVHTPSIIHYYMYICKILNKPKRLRKFFAMRDFGEFGAGSWLRTGIMKIGREPTQIYTDIQII